MITIREHISINQFGLWYQLFKLTGGRFLQNPHHNHKRGIVYVTYEIYDDRNYVDLCNKFKVLTTPVIEKKAGKLELVLRKIGFKK